MFAGVSVHNPLRGGSSLSNHQREAQYNLLVTIQSTLLHITKRSKSTVQAGQVVPGQVIK